MQRFITAILCSIVWLTGVVSDVEAGISVRYRAYGSTDNTAWTSTLPGGSSITYDYTNWQSNTEGVTVTISGDGDWWFRCANPGTESIGKIVFSGSGNVRLFITAPDGSGLGPTDLSTSAALGTSGCLHLADVTPGSATVTLQATIGGDVKYLHSSGSGSPRIEADRIVRLDAGGGMTNPIIVHNSTTADLTAIRTANSINDDLSSTSGVSQEKVNKGATGLPRGANLLYKGDSHGQTDGQLDADGR